MAIVIEWLTRSGAGQRIERFDKPRVRIGRSFDQDVILEDPFVDGEHLIIEENSDTLALRCIELGSRNGTRCQGAAGGKRVIEGAAPLHSGDVVSLGRTRLRVFHSSHPVPEAMPLNRWHQGLNQLCSWPLVLILILAVVSLYALNAYTNLPLEKHIQRYALEALYPLLGVFIYALFWALIGRVLRGDGRLMAHMALALGVVLASLILQSAKGWLAYHVGFTRLLSGLDALLLCVVAFLLFNASLHLATHLRALPRAALALMLPFVIALGQWLEYIGREEPRLWVPYQRALVAPALNIKPSITSSDFIEQTTDLYQSPDPQKEPR